MKGLSQVITSTLILAVGVAVAGVYANWAPDFAEGVAGQTADQQSQELRCDNSALRIDSAAYDLSANFTEVEVTNTGTINLRDQLTAAAINNSRIIGTEDINHIEVDSQRIIRIDSNETPESVVITSNDCPELEASEENIPEK